MVLEEWSGELGDGPCSREPRRMSPLNQMQLRVGNTPCHLPPDLRRAERIAATPDQLHRLGETTQLICRQRHLRSHPPQPKPGVEQIQPGWPVVGELFANDEEVAELGHLGDVLTNHAEELLGLSR